MYSDLPAYHRTEEAALDWTEWWPGTSTYLASIWQATIPEHRRDYYPKPATRRLGQTQYLDRCQTCMR